ncbi:MAG: AbrB/MazE/SpoVT family DNA-binding domain-containing protein [Burkholderiales bacterium]|nr:AbrB/MazE/SpoVT family DNA-binding domain-containing protein [Burkholderiales bacterium]
MDTVVSTKGQIVIPKRLRDQWGLTSGSRVKIASTAAGIQITPIAARNAKAVLKGLGLSGYKGKTIAIEDMDPLAALKVPR